MGGYSESPTFSKADNPTAHQAHFLTRLFTFLFLPAFNSYLLLFPRRLSYDWSMDAIPPISRLCDPRNILSFLFYVIILRRILLSLHIINTPVQMSPPSKGICALCWINPIHRTNNNSLLSRPMTDVLSHYNHAPSIRINGIHSHRTTKSRSQPKSSPSPRLNEARPSTKSLHGAVLLQLAFLIWPFLPATNLFFYVGFVVAERVTYMPSVGFCLLIGHGALHIWTETEAWPRFGRKAKFLLKVCGTICVVVLSLRTLVRNEDWASEERLYRAGIQINPPKSWGNLGYVLSRAGRRAEAEVAYRQALTFRSNMADVHYNL